MRVVGMPQLGPLVFRIPAMLRIAEGEDAFLCARLFLVAPRATDGGVETVLVQRLLQRLGFHDVGVHRGAMRQRRNALAHAVLIDMHQHVHVTGRRHLVAERDHLAELPGGIHVQQGDRRLARVKGLAQQMQQYRRILADRIQHHRILEAGHHLAENVDAFRLEIVEMCTWCSGDGHQWEARHRVASGNTPTDPTDTRPGALILGQFHE